jgi:phosphoribosyl-ATP pyrophosphohydrolase/phosphoribosyl-AMP cyclohydrolase
MLDLEFDKMHGLLPVVLQDAESGAVLMVGFMNREALEKTLESGFATFFSRSRNQLWTKGETSGNLASVESISADCDRDALLVRVRVQGHGRICHEGTVSCFTHTIELSAPVKRGISQ